METGRNFDPVALADFYGIKIERSTTQSNSAWYQPTHTIHLPHGLDRAAERTAITYALGWAVLAEPSTDAVIDWSAQYLLPDRDLQALSEVSADWNLWARALDVDHDFLTAYLSTIDYQKQRLQ